jgi:hypothetical protein
MPKIGTNRAGFIFIDSEKTDIKGKGKMQRYFLEKRE